jgi:hypothetical protein
LVYRGGTDAFAVWHPAKLGPVRIPGHVNNRSGVM